MEDERAYILDSKNCPQKRGDALVSYFQNSGNLEFVLSLISDGEGYVRSSSAKCLALSKNRNIYDPLIKLACDSDLHVRGDALIAMGQSLDSRFTFPLINYFKHTGYELKKRVFLALEALADPRAICFLKEHTGDSNDLGNLALRAYASCDLNNSFLYSYVGPLDLYDRALNIEGRILVDDLKKLDDNLYILIEHGFDRPQTYVIDEEGNFFIGGLFDEHVYAAQGKKVLTAGEIEFINSGSGWGVQYCNNRSNGYYPAENSFIHLSKTLSNLGIKNISEFNEVFPKDGFCDEEFLSLQPFYHKIQSI